jgi:hypothetical protein
VSQARGRVIAVMQPYFFPYAGYYRLFACAECLVILDCVQFPRRGRVHRCEVPAPGGGLEWLTLPLARQPRDVLIRDLAFAPGADKELERRLVRHRWIAAAAPTPAAEALGAALRVRSGPVADYLETQLRLTAELLDMPVRIIRSSSFGLPPTLRGQERILAIVLAAGGTSYVNPPGGRALYDPARFRRAGLSLGFLPRYEGQGRSILPELLAGERAALRTRILAQAVPDFTHEADRDDRARQPC